MAKKAGGLSILLLGGSILALVLLGRKNNPGTGFDVRPGVLAVQIWDPGTGNLLMDWEIDAIIGDTITWHTLTEQSRTSLAEFRALVLQEYPRWLVGWPNAQIRSLYPSSIPGLSTEPVVLHQVEQRDRRFLR